jgi:beta-glucanase (GH16 family)
MVKATVEGKTTAYSAFFYLNDKKTWKHLATFQTLTGGEPLKGYYSFVEDFRRNSRSARQVRKARFGNGWGRTVDGLWQPITQVTFTADNTPVMNIDAGVENNRFFLQNGGETVNHTPLRSSISCSTDDFVRPDDPQWTPVWSDEFDTPGRPDPAKWGYEVGFIRNNEKQYYTNDRRENARVEDGSLIIESRKEAYKDNAQYTSASLTTEGKAQWTGGRIEVRAKLPTGRGTWPAIWMLGTNIRQVGWPTCGEIDIMENVGFNPEMIHANIHTQSYNHVRGTGKGSKITISTPWEGFHIYAVEWFEDHMDFFVDNIKYFSFKNEDTGNAVWPYDKPHYLIINTAIGGAWGGQKGIDDSIFPQKYYIDYVRVYEKKEIRGHRGYFVNAQSQSFQTAS